MRQIDIRNIQEQALKLVEQIYLNAKMDKETGMLFVDLPKEALLYMKQMKKLND